MDSLQFDELASMGFNLGFEYGKTWFVLFLVVVLGLFIYRTIKGL